MAAAPAGLKFVAKFLDKGVNLTKPWVRTQEYASVVGAATGGIMMYTNTYPDMGRSVLDGSIAIFADQILDQFFKITDSPAKRAAAVANKKAVEQKQLTSGIPAPQYAPTGVRSGISVLEI